MKINVIFQGNKLSWWNDIKSNVMTFKLPDIIPGPQSTNVFDGNLEIKFQETTDNKIEKYISSWMQSVRPNTNPISAKTHFVIIKDDIAEGSIQVLQDDNTTLINEYKFKEIYPVRIIFGHFPDEFTKTVEFH